MGMLRRYHKPQMAVDEPAVLAAAAAEVQRQQDAEAVRLADEAKAAAQKKKKE